jgi:hypothetical protein
MKSDILIFGVVAFLEGFDRMSVITPVVSFHFLETHNFKPCNRMWRSSSIIVIARPRSGKLASSAITMASMGRLDVARRLRATSLLMSSTIIAVVVALVKN